MHSLKDAPTTTTISINAVGSNTSKGTPGKVCVNLIGVDEQELAEAVATHIDVDTLIAAIGDDVVRTALNARRRGS